MRGLDDGKWSVPNDIAVLGFDDQPIAKVVEPAITTIRQPNQMLAEKAVKLMIALINNKKIAPEYEEVLPFELIVRESTVGKK